MLAASEDYFLIGEAVVAADEVIVGYEGIAENHEMHTPGNVAEIAGVGKVATFDSVGSRTCFLAQGYLVRVEGQAIFPSDLAAWNSEVPFSSVPGPQDLVDGEAVNMIELLSCDEKLAEEDLVAERRSAWCVGIAEPE